MFRLQFLQRDPAGEHICLPVILRRLAGVELRHHLAGEQLQAVADRLVAGVARLIEQDHLIDMASSNWRSRRRIVSGEPIKPLRNACFALSVCRQSWYSRQRSPVPGASIPFRP